MKKKSLNIKISLLGLIFILLFFGILNIVIYPNKLILKNSTNDQIIDIRVNLHSVDKEWEKVIRNERLKPEDIIVIRHNQNDLSVNIQYVIEGEEKYFEEKYIDYWKGERWLLDIQNDGNIKSGYQQNIQ